MELTPDRLELLKEHMRLEGTSEDRLLTEYYAWAYIDLVDAITGESIPDDSFFENNKLFNAAIFPLTAYYFENRIAFDSVTRDVQYAPHMVLSVVHKLRYQYAVRG